MDMTCHIMILGHDMTLHDIFTNMVVTLLIIETVLDGFGRFCMVFHYVPTRAVPGTTTLSHSLGLKGIPWVPRIHHLVYHPKGFELFTCWIRPPPPPCPNLETHVNHHNPRRQGGLQEFSSQSRVGIYWPSIPFATCDTGI